MLELLSDTGLGKEMHSVVSQGRVEAIVTSKPRDRRMLIEEAAGLGKHRKRRRRAQLKLARTQDNLDRALDVEREARSRLRPLKRQAEAAELHERLARQTDEALWALAREDVRAAGAALREAEAAVAAARAAAAETETKLRAVAARREAAEEALSSRGSEREALSNRFYAARSAHERIGHREEAARQAVAQLDDRCGRRRALVNALEAERASDVGDDGAGERIAALEGELAQLAEDRRERLERELEALVARREAAVAELVGLGEAADAAAEVRREADAAAEAARRTRREAETAAEAARREAARTGAELAKLNQFLRTHAGAPGGAAALADDLSAEPGYELALAAALGPRLRAAVAPDLAEGGALLDRAGRDGGAALIVPDAAPAVDASAPAATAQRLRDHVKVAGDDRLVSTLLAGVWVVDVVRRPRRLVRRRGGHARRSRLVALARASCARCRPAARTTCCPSATGATRSSPTPSARPGPSTPRWRRSRRSRAPCRWPTPRATRPSAAPVPPSGRATRPPRPSATPAG